MAPNSRCPEPHRIGKPYLPWPYLLTQDLRVSLEKWQALTKVLSVQWGERLATTIRKVHSLATREATFVAHSLLVCVPQNVCLC